MIAGMRAFVAAVAAMGLMVLALWTLGQSGPISEALVSASGRPGLEQWAVCCGAVAAIAGAQLLVLVFVVGWLYARRFSDDILQTCVGLTGSLALIAAVILGVAGR